MEPAKPSKVPAAAGARALPSGWRARLLHFASKRWTIRAWYVVVVGFFLILVLIPTLFVLTYVVTGWSVIQQEVLSNPSLVAPIAPAIGLSFGVAIAVAIIDLTTGLPLAWLIVRHRFRGKSWFNTLIDSPLAVTTAGLGFSVVLFWGIAPGIGVSVPGSLGLTGNPFLILMLLHLTTTFPYMVRSLAAILEEIEIEYENAARAAGASRLTAARTITLPMFRSGMATGLILVLAKALSDTGGAYLALNLIGSCTTAGATVCNGTGLINVWKLEAGATPALNQALALVSAIMIVLSILLLVVVKYVAVRLKFPLKRVWPIAERRLSKGAPAKGKTIGALAFLVFFILVPSFFFLGLVAVSTPKFAMDWGRFGSAVGYSFLIGGVATAVDLGMGIPMALLITRGRIRWLGRVMDALVNVPYIVPSAALGISLSLFWKPAMIPSDLVLVTMAHIAFTFPFIVRNVVGALEQLDPALEETARTLGAKPVQAFSRVVLPAIRPAILAGSIMAFTRSVGETGATVAVVGGRMETAPVLIVNLLTNKDLAKRDPYGAALAQIVLLIISFAAIFGMRFFAQRGRRRG
jgi:ABC-type sulfate transport system permease component